MEAYYQQQSVSPYFAGHYRQRGSGFGALAARIGRAAIPIAKKFLWPVAKKIGRELFVQAAPEIVDVVTKKKSPKETLKPTVQKTVRKTSWWLKSPNWRRSWWKCLQKTETERSCQIPKNHSEKRTVTEKSVRFLFQSGK